MGKIKSFINILKGKFIVLISTIHGKIIVVAVMGILSAGAVTGVVVGVSNNSSGSIVPNKKHKWSDLKPSTKKQKQIPLNPSTPNKTSYNVGINYSSFTTDKKIILSLPNGISFQSDNGFTLNGIIVFSLSDGASVPLSITKLNVNKWKNNQLKLSLTKLKNPLILINFTFQYVLTPSKITLKLIKTTFQNPNTKIPYYGFKITKIYSAKLTFNL